jgi:AcrR family transcriptional regulator
VAAALRVVDAEGVDAVTMRRVGQELGTGGASLYAHLDGKDELLDLVFDRVVGEIDYTGLTPDPRRWREQLKEYCRRVHQVLLSHRDIAKVAMGQVPLGPNAVAGMEVMLSLMRASKISDRVIGYGSDLIAQYVTASAYEASLFMARLETPDGRVDYAAELGRYFASLPADRFPTLVGMAEALAADDDDGTARFEFGLEVLINGLAATKL